MLSLEQKGLFALLRSAISGKKEKLPDGFSLAKVEALTHNHNVSVLLFYGASYCEISPLLPEMNLLLEQTAQYMIANDGQIEKLNGIKAAFDKAGVDYLLLKGAEMKQLYPKSEMRSMSDADILIKTEQLPQISAVMTAEGFTGSTESDHEIHWIDRQLHIELHKSLMPSYNPAFYDYFKDWWKLAKRLDNSSHCYKFSNEDFYIYLFAHFVKHYLDGGIGLSQLIDLYVYRNHYSLNEKYIRAELEKLRIYKFYQNIQKLLNVIFREEESDEVSEQILATVLSSGAYGTSAAHNVSWATRKTSQKNDAKTAKMLYTLELIFLPYWRMCLKYPILKKVPVLLPVMWVVRWFDTLFFKHDRIKKNQKKMKMVTTKSIEQYQKDLETVGLKIDFFGSAPE